MIKKIKNFFVCLLFPKQVLYRVLKNLDTKTIEKETQEKHIEDKKINKNLIDTLNHTNLLLIYSVMYDFKKELDYPVDKLHISGIEDLYLFCKDRCIECYHEAIKNQSSYYIESARFRFGFNYHTQSFSIEYILTESGKEY